MIFVVGIPRSGTTWVSSLLAEHPDCERLTQEKIGWSPKEPTLETGLFLRGFSDEEIRSLIPPNEKTWVEKTPAHLFHIEDIRRVFPEAKVVLIKRKREDVIRSMLNAVHWKGRPKTRAAAERLHDSYPEISPDVCFEYETLWKSPDMTTLLLFAALKLDPSYASEAVTKTWRGRNLPKALKTVYSGGST